MGIDDNNTMKHENIQTEAEHVGTVYVGGIDQRHSRRWRTDEEIKEIEILARSRGIFHWGGIVRIINRLRKAEAGE